MSQPKLLTRHLQREVIADCRPDLSESEREDLVERVLQLIYDTAQKCPPAEESPEYWMP